MEDSSQTGKPIQGHLDRLLKSREYPKTICPSEVARALSSKDLEALGVSEWRATMPMVREVVWQMRDAGRVEILQKGEVLGDVVSLNDVTGPIRVRLGQNV